MHGDECSYSSERRSGTERILVTDHDASKGQRRCAWARADPLMRAYHDDEWGVPEYDGRRLWEALMLDGFQAGLSWTIILRKREAFRRAFRGFDPELVARFRERDVTRILADAGVVRSRAKIEATIGGARAYLAMQEAEEDFSTYVWKLAGGSPIQNRGPVPTRTPLSERFSEELKGRGFKFVGPTIVYAWMQAIGVVNDHASDCFRRGPVRAMARRNTLGARAARANRARSTAR